MAAERLGLEFTLRPVVGLARRRKSSISLFPPLQKIFLTAEKKSDTFGGRMGSRNGWLACGGRGLPDRHPQAQEGLSGYPIFSCHCAGRGV